MLFSQPPEASQAISARQNTEDLRLSLVCGRTTAISTISPRGNGDVLSSIRYVSFSLDRVSCRPLPFGRVCSPLLRLPVAWCPLLGSAVMTCGVGIAGDGDCRAPAYSGDGEDEEGNVREREGSTSVAGRAGLKPSSRFGLSCLARFGEDYSRPARRSVFRLRRFAIRTVRRPGCWSAPSDGRGEWSSSALPRRPRPHCLVLASSSFSQADGTTVAFGALRVLLRVFGSLARHDLRPRSPFHHPLCFPASSRPLLSLPLSCPL